MSFLIYYMSYSLNNGILKPPDRTRNEYNSLSFSEIVSPIITGSKNFGTISSIGFLRLFPSGMACKK